ncbi:GNAT family N-acetyltransferase [Pelomyxa schiedti]|nr:GNAT family N-acetyltransferase [Pelomyxa schiedti]
MHACVWVVLEHHSETLEKLSRHINTISPKLGPHTTPWPIVHKYSRDICAALVHLFVNQIIHFDIKLDNIVVSSNKEQAILIDFGCATRFPRISTTRRPFETETMALISVTGNTSHRAPEIINGIARYRQNPDHSSTLCCEKQPSFELGCILFELAMCGKHPLPGYPGGYGPSGKVTFTFESEDLFPMKPPQFPKEFCDLVRSLLQYDQENRMPLLRAFEVLLNIESPSPSELLSFYSCVVPLTNDAGTLASKATCQILCGSSTEDCVDTLNKALDVEPFFSPALLLLHYLSLCQMKTDSRHQQAVQASLIGKTASFTATDVEYTRAIINKKHRTTLPELVLTALWTRHISQDSETFNTTLLLLKKSPAIQQQHPPVSIFLKSLIYTRNEMMMEALLELENGDIDSALAFVANAFSLFECEVIPTTGDSHQCDYLPALLFLYCVHCVINDHVSLHQHIPTCLSLTFSHPLSHATDMRKHCMSVLRDTKGVSEWKDLVSTASFRSKHWSCMYFVASWCMFCSSSTDKPDSSAAHFFVEMSEMPPSREKPITCSVGQINWSASSFTSLGLCYQMGIGGVKKDDHKAVSLYQRAVDAGDAQAMCNLAVFYEWGDDCVGQDINKAVKLWQRAAGSGNTEAMNRLSRCYYLGEGVGKDRFKAATLQERARAGEFYSRSVMDVGVRVTLRSIEETDTELWYKWLTDPDVTRYMFFPTVSMEWVRRRTSSAATSGVMHQTDFVFGIDYNSGGSEWVSIGYGGLYNVDWKSRNTSLGITIGEKSLWGKNIGTEAVWLLCRYAFKVLNLHRVELICEAENTRGARCYARCGFKNEAVKRHYAFKEGRYVDALLMSILEDELPCDLTALIS